MMRLVFKSSAENSAVVPFFCSHRCGTPLVPAVQIWLSAFDYNGAMSARTAGYLEAIEHLPEGAILVVPGVSWEEYEELLGDLGARPGVHVSYDQGRLEIMSPLREHEKCKEFISDLARAFAEENNFTLEKFGSTTWKRRRLKKGTEPDACFYLATAARIMGKRKIDLDSDPPPDVAVEIDTTNESRAKFSIYAALGIPEIWRYDGRQVEIYNLKGGSYVRTNASDFLGGSRIDSLLRLESNRSKDQSSKCPP